MAAGRAASTGASRQNRFRAVLCRTTEAIIRFVVGNASPDVNPPGARKHFARAKPEIQTRWGWFWISGLARKARAPE
jgi:hypothetical protein